MDVGRRRFLCAGLVGMAGGLSGCTAELYRRKEYKEEVSSVLFTEDMKKIVVIGRGYHYIFDAPEALVHSLRSNLHAKMHARFYPFDVHADQRITGKLSLLIDVELSAEEVEQAMSLGFKPRVESGYVLHMELSGIRYDSGGIQATAPSQRLNKTYTVSVSVDHTAMGYAKRAALTPVTVAADGVLMVVGFVLLSFIAIAISYNNSN
ncbi:MAG: hypothetical protein HUJ28_04105 [Chromatiales bacterium]|nr:hypothetical protein [Chromatiales bacterium]